jgi:hypothetical protein
LHAYTLPRVRPNSLLKELPDLALLARVKSLDAKRVRAALDQTFTFRKTHDLPATRPNPPATWAAPYAATAAEDQLLWPTLSDVTAAARAFLDLVLADAPTRRGTKTAGSGDRDDRRGPRRRTEVRARKVLWPPWTPHR